MHSNPATPAPSSRATESKKHRVLLADDHALFRRGVGALIATTADFEVVAEASNPEETLAKLRTTPVDVALLDLSFDGTNGIELTKQIRAELPDLRIILLSMHDENVYAMRSLKAGAQGYVMKREEPAMIVEALRKVVTGKIFVSPRVSQSLVYRTVQTDSAEPSPIELLSDRELEVLQMFGEGSGTQEVAARLHLSAKTVETHRLHIKEKLGFKSASELVRFAVSWVRLQGGDLREPAASAS
jgi:DNA-binding NarL/FixJ family response regulator